LKQLLKLGLKPGLLILESVEAAHWKDAERFWIAALKLRGCRLVNVDRGGQGGSRSGSKRSLETRRKMSEAAMGNKNAQGHVPSAETRKKIGAANRVRRLGTHLSAVTKAKLSRALKGNKNALGPQGYALGRDG
jgi:hypothetical protein